jgi:hypothetical protein
MALSSSSCSSNAPGSRGRNSTWGLVAAWRLNSGVAGSGGGKTTGEGALCAGLDTGLGDPRTGVPEFTKGLGGVAEEGREAVKGVGTPPVTGGAVAGLIAASLKPHSTC